MINGTSIFAIQNALSIYLPGASLYNELTKNNIYESLLLKQKVFALANQANISYDEVDRVFTNSHNDHVEHTNQELFSCCMEMESYLKTLPETLSSVVSKPSFNGTDSPKTEVEKIEQGVQQTKNAMNTRLKNVCKSKQNIFCDDGIYTLIEMMRKQPNTENLNFKSVETQLHSLSTEYLNHVDMNYDHLFVTFSNSIDNIMKKTNAVKENNQEEQMMRATSFVDKKVNELTGVTEPDSPFQNEEYQGTRSFVTDPLLTSYYPLLISQIESYRATDKDIAKRAFDVLFQFGLDQQEKLQPEQISIISHNVLKMLKIDSNLITSKNEKDDTEEKYIICNPEQEKPVLFDPTRQTVIDDGRKSFEKPYTITLDQEAITKLKEGESITVGNEFTTNDNTRIYQEKCTIGPKTKALIKTKPEAPQQPNVQA